MNVIKLESDVKLDECVGCKIWNNRYGLENEKCPHCMHLDIETVWVEFDRAFTELVEKGDINERD